MSSIQGSSPHTRETRRRRGSRWPRGRDHPRIRGEHETVSTGGHDRLGSSPHTRGTQRRGRVRRCPRGIIPAYAGNTSIELPGAADKAGSSPHTRGTPAVAPSIPRSAWDHPRIRGEHPSGNTTLYTKTGIIPAYAGNTVMCHG